MGIRESTGARAVTAGQYHTKNGVAEATPFFVMFADKIRTTKVREKRKDMNPIGRR